MRGGSGATSPSSSSSSGNSSQTRSRTSPKSTANPKSRGTQLSKRTLKIVNDLHGQEALMRRGGELQRNQYNKNLSSFHHHHTLGDAEASAAEKAEMEAETKYRNTNSKRRNVTNGKSNSKQRSKTGYAEHGKGLGRLGKKKNSAAKNDSTGASGKGGILSHTTRNATTNRNRNRHKGGAMTGSNNATGSRAGVNNNDAGMSSNQRGGKAGSHKSSQGTTNEGGGGVGGGASAGLRGGNKQQQQYSSGKSKRNQNNSTSNGPMNGQVSGKSTTNNKRGLVKKRGRGGVTSAGVGGDDQQVAIKVLLLGDSGVGKTSLLNRFASNQFKQNLMTTAGVDFKVQHLEIDGRHIKLSIWDTAGQERFHIITRAYYKGSHGIALVYDVGDPRTRDNIEYWARNIREHGEKDSVTMLVANKIDLPEDEQVCTRAEGESMAENFNMKFVETSAKNGEGVQQAFFELARDIVEKSGGVDLMKKGQVKKIRDPADAKRKAMLKAAKEAEEREKKKCVIQ
eukprot:g695.t1